MTRHQMRQYVFILTFERMFNDMPIEQTFEIARECDDVIKLNKDVIEMTTCIDQKKEELDGEISKYLKNWTIARISRVSLAILRVAMYEILYCDDIETSIAISEAVKLAQTFTLKDDVSFINGVLATVSKEKGE